MPIAGLQKLTLLDYPGKVACTVFLSGCNFRCPFCHNGGILSCSAQEETAMPQTELLEFLKKRRGLLDGVCISGGEPLLQDGLEELLRAIKQLGYAVKLDTNGSFPEKLRLLTDAELVDYIAMDIKNSKKDYADTIGKKDAPLAAIEKSAAFLLSNQLPYEFRTTVVRQLHHKENILEIGQWIAGAQKYFLQPFVASSQVPSKELTGYERSELEQFQKILTPFVPNVEIRGV